MIEVKMSLNMLARRCGYFFNAYLTEGYEDKPNINNGYNCSHPDCGDEDEGIGCCRADTCPLPILPMVAMTMTRWSLRSPKKTSTPGI